MPWRLLLEPSFELGYKLDSTKYMDLFLSRFSIDGQNPFCGCNIIYVRCFMKYMDSSGFSCQALLDR
jgi:hypothetical protein